MSKSIRCLDIGPGSQPAIPTSPDEVWESLDAYAGYNPTYLGDCRNTGLPNDHFDIVHASHIIEHVEWHEIESTLAEWKRILKPGGRLEVWTVNASPIMERLVHYERTGEWDKGVSTWQEKLTKLNPFLHWSGRILNYSKKGSNGDLNLHRSMYTPRFMREMFEKVGMENVRSVEHDEFARGTKHKHINMGVHAEKPA